MTAFYVYKCVCPEKKATNTLLSNVIYIFLSFKPRKKTNIVELCNMRAKDKVVILKSCFSRDIKK